MAHHGAEKFDIGDWAEQMKGVKDPKKLMHEPTFRKPPMIPLLGATGEFPNGKLTDDDEGEIAIGITTKDDVVIIDFGKPIAWIGFSKEQAKEIGELLIKKATR